jgi:transcriptional regulator with XRE-family HTH domain
MKFGEVQQVVGQRVREARMASGMTQASLASAVGTYVEGLGTRAAVSVAEGGGRGFQAHELLALAVVLDRPVGWFLAPAGRKTLQVGDRRLGRRELGRVGVTDGTDDSAVGVDRVAVSNLTSECVGLAEMAHDLFEKAMKVTSDAAALDRETRG